MAWMDEMKCLHRERSGGYRNISCMLGVGDTEQWKLLTFPPVSAETCDDEFDFRGVLSQRRHLSAFLKFNEMCRMLLIRFHTDGV